MPCALSFVIRDDTIGTVLVMLKYKKLTYRRRITRCIVLVEILPIATQQCRNYLYDKS